MVGVSPAAAVETSWDDWTTSDIGTTQLFTTKSARSIEPVGYISNNTFYVLTSNPVTPFYYNNKMKYTRSGTTLSLTSETSVTTTFTMNFTGSNVLELVGFGKVLMVDGGANYLVGDISSGDVTIATGTPSTISGHTGLSNYSITHHPDDEGKLIAYDDDGDTNYYTFDNSTDTMTWVRSGTKPTSANRVMGFYTQDTDLTYKFALMYYHTTNLDWRIRHYAKDLSSYTDVTLNATPDPTGSVAKFGNLLQKLNTCLVVMGDVSTSAPAWSVTYNGSSFTQNTTGALSIPGTYTQIRTIMDVHFVQDNTWAVIVQWQNPDNTLQRPTYVHMVKVDSSTGAVTELGKIELTSAGANASNVRGGIALSSDKSSLIAVAEEENSGTFSVSASLILKPA
jgi:hypothetical protein